MNTIYLVIYRDYDVSCEIRGYFTDESKAEKCKEYELKLLEKEEDYGRRVDVVPVNCLDNEDFDAKIIELKRKEIEREEGIKEAIKRMEMAELARLRQKYGV